MTAEEIFCDLFDKYGEDFNWYMVPLSHCSIATIQDIAKQDYVLTPGRYVGIEEQEE